MNTYTLTMSECPACHHRVDRAGDNCHNRKPPSPGDLGVCACCGEALAITEDLGIRLATLDDLLRLTEEEHELFDGMQKKVRRERPCG